MKNPNGRRWSAVLLVLIFALSLVLAGCHEEPQEPESDVSAAATTTAPEESTEPSGSEPAETTEPSASVTPDDPASSGGTKAPVKPGGTSTQRPLGTTAVTKANGTTKPDGTTAPTSPATTGRTTRKPGEATNGYIQPQFFISTFKALPHSTGASLETFKKIVRLNKEAAIMSRAVAGAVGTKLVASLPGSRNAVRLAVEKLLVPELAHIVFELKKHQEGS